METLSDNTQMGADLIKSLYHIVNAIKIHQDNNQLVRESIARFKVILAEISGGDDFNLKIWRGRFYLQGKKLLFQRETFNFINKMVDYFNQRGIVGLTFRAKYIDAATEDFLAFTRILTEASKYNDPEAWLFEKLDKSCFPWVDLSMDQEEGTQKADSRRKEKARYAYFQALNTVKDVAIKTSKGLTGVRKARRLAQTLVDLIQEDISLLLGMSTIKQYDDYTYNHSVNVALLATCLGRSVGLSEVYLEHLTVCGLFHDLGKVEIPKDIIFKKGSLSEEEQHEMQKHPLVGIRQILNLHAPHSLRSRIILGPFEHHLNIDLSGYPKTHFIKELSLMGKILRIADVYEALTADRVYRPRAFTPDEALRRMWSEIGTSFDPFLLKSFINMMGIYPVGSFVELDTGEIGLVMEYTDDTDRSLPVIILLADDGNGSLTRGETINLAGRDEDVNAPIRKIIIGIPPARLGVQPAHFLLQTMVEPVQKMLP